MFILFLAGVNGIAMFLTGDRYAVTGSTKDLLFLGANAGFTAFWFLLHQRCVSLSRWVVAGGLYLVLVCTITLPVGMSVLTLRLLAVRQDIVVVPILHEPHCTYYGVPVDCGGLSRRLACREEDGCVEL